MNNYLKQQANILKRPFLCKSSKNIDNTFCSYYLNGSYTDPKDSTIHL